MICQMCEVVYSVMAAVFFAEPLETWPHVSGKRVPDFEMGVIFAVGKRLTKASSSFAQLQNPLSGKVKGRVLRYVNWLVHGGMVGVA